MENIDVSKITPNPSQARTTFDKETLKGLAATIKTHGILQPITVNKMKNGYELVAGERRLRASKMANAKTIPAIVKNVNAEQQAEQSLIENIQRDNLTSYEKGKALKAMKGDRTNEQLADDVGLGRHQVEEYLVVAGLDKTVVGALENAGHTNVSVAASIARIIKKDGTPDKPLQLKVAEKTKDWTNKEARELIPIIKNAPEDMAYEIMKGDYDVETAREAIRTKAIIDEKLGVVEASEDSHEKGKKFLNQFQSDADDLAKRANYMAQNGQLYEDIKVVKTSVKLLMNTLSKLYEKQLN